MNFFQDVAWYFQEYVRVRLLRRESSTRGWVVFVCRSVDCHLLVQPPPPPFLVLILPAVLMESTLQTSPSGTAWAGILSQFLNPPPSPPTQWVDNPPTALMPPSSSLTAPPPPPHSERIPNQKPSLVSRCRRRQEAANVSACLSQWRPYRTLGSWYMWHVLETKEAAYVY